MSKKNYQKKLQDPRWQKKRLKILERDGWKCTNCGENLEQLEVHHTDYIPNTNPWEYPDSMLVSLCNQCHGYAHKLRLLERFGFYESIIAFDSNNTSF